MTRRGRTGLPAGFAGRFGRGVTERARERAAGGVRRPVRALADRTGQGAGGSGCDRQDLEELELGGPV